MDFDLTSSREGDRPAAGSSTLLRGVFNDAHSLDDLAYDGGNELLSNS